MRRLRRILIVEDFKPFRRLIASLLLAQQGSYEIYESPDGLDAVKRALELKPDVITMDIGLPDLNGIEAARRIREALPEAKILFVSQETSPDVLQEAQRAGASGYIHKSRASRDLLAGISDLCDGNQPSTPAVRAFTPVGDSRENTGIVTQSAS